MKAQRKPMTVREVYLQTIKQGLYDFKAKDPIHVVRTQIRRHLVSNTTDSYSSRNVFEAVGKNEYQLSSGLLHETQSADLDESAAPSTTGAQPPSTNRETTQDRTDLNRSAKKTIILAIKDVMESHGKPMTVQQVYEAIVARNLYSFKASQPAHVVRSQIRRHCLGLDFPTASDLKHFTMRGKNRYYVLPDPVKQKSKLGKLGMTSANRFRGNELADRDGGSRRHQVFISYSHKDSKWLQRLQVHLKPMLKLGIIDLWDDTRIKPGARWRTEIERAVKRAKVAVMLISADFLASEFIMDNELAPLLQAAESDGVIVSPCRFEKTQGLRQFQSVNPPSRSLIGMDRTKREEVFVRIADAIEAVIYPQ